MSVYVDPLFGTVPKKNWPYTQACHLTADTEEELHAFAQRLFGSHYRRAWFQHHHADPIFWHYDLTRGMRVRACALGAVELTWQEWTERVKQHRVASIKVDVEHVGN